jgi:hypothetical protein
MPRPTAGDAVLAAGRIAGIAALPAPATARHTRNISLRKRLPFAWSTSVTETNFTINQFKNLLPSWDPQAMLRIPRLLGRATRAQCALLSSESSKAPSIGEQFASMAYGKAPEVL